MFRSTVLCAGLILVGLTLQLLGCRGSHLEPRAVPPRAALAHSIVDPGFRGCTLESKLPGFLSLRGARGGSPLVSVANRTRSVRFSMETGEKELWTFVTLDEGPLRLRGFVPLDELEPYLQGPVAFGGMYVPPTDEAVKIVASSHDRIRVSYTFPGREQEMEENGALQPAGAKKVNLEGMQMHGPETKGEESVRCNDLTFLPGCGWRGPGYEWGPVFSTGEEVEPDEKEAPQARILKKGRWPISTNEHFPKMPFSLSSDGESSAVWVLQSYGKFARVEVPLSNGALLWAWLPKSALGAAGEPESGGHCSMDVGRRDASKSGWKTLKCELELPLLAAEQGGSVWSVGRAVPPFVLAAEDRIVDGRRRIAFEEGETVTGILLADADLLRRCLPR